jgi:hypothetical protein
MVGLAMVRILLEWRRNLPSMGPLALSARPVDGKGLKAEKETRRSGANLPPVAAQVFANIPLDY